MVRTGKCGEQALAPGAPAEGRQARAPVTTLAENEQARLPARKPSLRGSSGEGETSTLTSDSTR